MIHMFNSNTPIIIVAVITLIIICMTIVVIVLDVVSRLYLSAVT